MKRKGLIIFTVLIIIYVVICQFSWHLNRNVHNILPKGKLMLINANIYQDENDLIWELQPHLMNVFHQPDEIAESRETPYPNMDKPPQLNIENPNLKLLRLTNDGESHEAILQPNGDYLTTGPKKSTYNYGHPKGVIGMIKHIILDVFPHFINSNYK